MPTITWAVNKRSRQAVSKLRLNLTKHAVEVLVASDTVVTSACPFSRKLAEESSSDKAKHKTRTSKRICLSYLVVPLGAKTRKPALISTSLLMQEASSRHNHLLSLIKQSLLFSKFGCAKKPAGRTLAGLALFAESHALLFASMEIRHDFCKLCHSSS